MLCLVSLGLAATLLGVQYGDQLGTLVSWVQRAGPLGLLVYTLLVLVAAAMMVPASLAELAAGFMWGPVWGFLIAWGATVVSSVSCALLGRTLLREIIEKKLADYPRFSALDRALAERGLPLVILLRLSPIAPFNVMTYLLALTAVRLRDFTIGTAIGTTVPILLYTYAGSSLTSLTDLTSRPENTMIHWAGLLLTLLVTLPISAYATRAVRIALNADEMHPSES